MELIKRHPENTKIQKITQHIGKRDNSRELDKSRSFFSGIYLLFARRYTHSILARANVVVHAQEWWSFALAETHAVVV